MTTCVLIADANVHLAEVMRQLLNDEKGFRVAALAHTPDETLDVARRERPDVVLLDPNLVRARDDLCAALHHVLPSLILLLWSNARKTGAVSEPHVQGIVQRGATYRQLVHAIKEAVDSAYANQEPRAATGTAPIARSPESG
jgi:DNA-binding NarL/FixJ family response regulator